MVVVGLFDLLNFSDRSHTSQDIGVTFLSNTPLKITPRSRKSEKMHEEKSLARAESIGALKSLILILVLVLVFSLSLS